MQRWLVLDLLAPTNSRPLRDYQQLCITHTLAAATNWTGPRKMYFTLPTGTGKTRCLTGIIDILSQYGRVLFVAHRKELIEQAAKTIAEDLATTPGIVMAERNQPYHDIVVGSIQTLQRDRFQPLLSGRPFGLSTPLAAILIDESHHVTPKNSYAALIEQVHQVYPEAAIIGCTATPYRSDRASMQDVLPLCTFSRSIPEMQRAGWLCPLQWQRLRVDLDLSNVKTSTIEGEKDYNAESLSEQLAPQSETIARKTIPLIGDRPTVVFACNVKHAQELAAAYNMAGGPMTAAIWGEMDKKEREYRLRDWKAGRIQIIVNVGILTEGFDYVPLAPNRNGLSALVVARPTMSPSLYLQMLGRGTRLKPAGADYDNCLVIDVGGNANLLETRQITLPRVMPSFDEELAEENGQPRERKEPQEKRPASLRINDPVSVSWVAWGFDQDSGLYYTGLAQNWYAAMLPDPRGTGLYYGLVYERKPASYPYKSWKAEQLTDHPLLLSEQMQHLNSVIAQNGRRALVDKDARWRKDLPSEKQLLFLRRISRPDYDLARMQGWTSGEVSHLLNWHIMKEQLQETMKGLL